jgi:predicted ferric reductase
MKLLFLRHICEKYSNINIHENPSSKSRVVSCELMDKRSDRWTHMTALLLAFCDFAKVL